MKIKKYKAETKDVLQFLSITFLKLRRKCKGNILAIKGAQCFAPKQLSIFCISNVSPACL